MEHTRLYRAVKRGDAIDVRRLLSEGCKRNGASHDLDGLLWVAAARGNTPVLRLLLDAGAKPNCDAVEAAAFGNHIKAVRLLLAAGAPVHRGCGKPPLLNILDWSGRSREELAQVRRLIREAGGRELPDWYLHWRWSIRYGWRWRLQRWLYSVGWRPAQRRHSG